MDECGINQGFSCIENYEVATFSAASGCQQNSDRQSRARVTEQRPLGLLVHFFFLSKYFRHIWGNTDIFTHILLYIVIYVVILFIYVNALHNISEKIYK